MTRGGARKGAGRPPTTGEKRTATIPVRVTPTQLAAYRETALRANMCLAAWVELHLDAAVLAER